MSFAVPTLRTTAWRRYNARSVSLALIYTVLLLGAVYGFKHHLFGGPIAWVAAILPALPVIGMFAAIGRYLVEEPDEYLRMLMVRQALWASGFALSVATLWGFLEAFDRVGHIEPYYVAVLWFGGLGFGRCITTIFGRETAS